MKIHIVEPNETLTTIAELHGLELEPLQKCNPTFEPRTVLEVGQKIQVPSHKVKVTSAPHVPQVVEESTPMPKWWAEERHEIGESEDDRWLEAEGEAHIDYAAYPAIDAHLLPAYPTHLNARFPAAIYPPPAVEPDWGSYYTPPAPAWPDPAALILASNRIPIPPRMTYHDGIRQAKMWDAYLRLDDEGAEWEENDATN